MSSEFAKRIRAHEANARKVMRLLPPKVESKIERDYRRACLTLGLEFIKITDNRGYPDRLIISGATNAERDQPLSVHFLETAFFLEIKTATGKLSAAQLAVFDRLAAQKISSFIAYDRKLFTPYASPEAYGVAQKIIDALC